MRHAVFLLALALAVSFVPERALGSQAGTPDLIVLNAQGYTFDQAFSSAQAFAVTDGKFTAVGTDAQIRRLAGAGTRVLNMGGKTITPGLQDDHPPHAGSGAVRCSSSKVEGDYTDACPTSCRFRCLISGRVGPRLLR